MADHYETAIRLQNRLLELRRQVDQFGDALIDATEYLRLASTWIDDTDRHQRMKAAWQRAENTLRDA